MFLLVRHHNLAMAKIAVARQHSMREEPLPLSSRVHALAGRSRCDEDQFKIREPELN